MQISNTQLKVEGFLLTYKMATSYASLHIFLHIDVIPTNVLYVALQLILMQS